MQTSRIPLTSSQLNTEFTPEEHERRSELGMSSTRSEAPLTNKLKESIANCISTEHAEEVKREANLAEKNLKNHFCSDANKRIIQRQGEFSNHTNSKENAEALHANDNLANNSYNNRSNNAKRERVVNRSDIVYGSSSENSDHNSNNNNSINNSIALGSKYSEHNSSSVNQNSNSYNKIIDKDSSESDEDVTKLDSPINPFHLRRDWYSAMATFAAGGLAGAASRTLTAPLDRIKIIVQEGHLVNTPEALWSSGRKHARLIDAARLINADGGWRAFWRGNLVNCFKAGPEFAIVFTLRRYLFSLYDECIQREEERRRVATAKWRQTRELSGLIAEREEMERHAMMMSSNRVEPTHSPVLVRAKHANLSSSDEHSINTSSSFSSSLSSPSSVARHTSSSSYSTNEVKHAINVETSIFGPPLNQWGCLSQIPMLAINCFIGATAGLVAQSVLYPMELVKTRVCVSRSGEYKGGVWEIIYDAYRTGGVREFFRGCTPNMVGIIVYRGLEMGFYSSAQQSIMLYRMQWQNKSRHQAALSTAEVGAVGAVASIIAQTISYPLNVVRTRLQTQGSNGRQYAYSGMIDCFVQLVRRKGVRSLFSGLTANYLKAVPASTCTFIVFEKVQELLLGDD